MITLVHPFLGLFVFCHATGRTHKLERSEEQLRLTASVAALKKIQKERDGDKIPNLSSRLEDDKEDLDAVEDESGYASDLDLNDSL